MQQDTTEPFIIDCRELDSELEWYALDSFLEKHTNRTPGDARPPALHVHESGAVHIAEIGIGTDLPVITAEDLVLTGFQQYQMKLKGGEVAIKAHQLHQNLAKLCRGAYDALDVYDVLDSNHEKHYKIYDRLVRLKRDADDLLDEIVSQRTPSPNSNKPMLKVPVEKTTFGELDPGDQFVTSARPLFTGTGEAYGTEDGSILNVKLQKEARIDPGAAPFNVICLDDGRPRAFYDNETVYKTHNDGRLEPPQDADLS